jgi:hypothetical protein
VVDTHDRLACGIQVPQHPNDCALGCSVHASEGLVENEKVSTLRQGAGQKHPLLLTAGELADLPLGESRHADLLQAAQRQGSLASAGKPEKANLPVETHHHHVEHGSRKVPVHPRSLRDIGDAVSGVRERVSEHGNLPRDPWDDTQRRLEKGGFTSAIWSDDCNHPTRRRGEVYVVHHRLSPIGDRHSAHAERDERIVMLNWAR